MTLMPTYSAGLRAGEVVKVRIDVERGPIRIRGGKGRNGCYTISSEAAPGQRKDKHISTRAVQSIFERARNSFATYPHESGVYLKSIQELPGHKHSKTTEIYTHMSTKNLSKIKSPLDLMGGEKYSE